MTRLRLPLLLTLGILASVASSPPQTAASQCNCGGICDCIGLCVLDMCECDAECQRQGYPSGCNGACHDQQVSCLYACYN
jgi:hypothetical protein